MYAAIVARTPSTTSAYVDAATHGQSPSSTIGISSGFTLIACSAGQQTLVRQAGEEAVDGPLEVRDVPFGPLGQAHVLEALRVQAPLLPGQVREVLRRDRRPPRVVALPHLGRRRPLGSAPSGNRPSDQISISVSSGPSGRKRYDDALLYIGSRKKCGKQ